MEKHSLLINKKVNRKEWVPLRCGWNGPTVSHLLFADDLLLFTTDNISQVRAVNMTRNEFGQASRLKVNQAKSKALCSTSVLNDRNRRLRNLSNFQFTTRFDKYLGLPLLHGRIKKQDFNFVTSIFSQMLASWRSKLLNRAGRITLAKPALPNYGMQTMWLPESICSKADRMVPSFIWKGNDGRGLHLVKWDDVTLPINLGGLEMHKTREANVSLLGKLVWDAPDELWVQLMKQKYIGDQGNILSHVCPNLASFGWRSIYKASATLRNGFGWHSRNDSHISL